MNKKFITTLGLATITLASTVLVQAADAPVADKTKAENNAQVEVLPGDDEPVDPIDPVDPTEPTEQKGKLTVDGIINFKFKNVNLKASQFKTGLKEKGKDDNQTEHSTNARSVQITDKRGTGEGWTLRLSQSEMRNYSVADQNSNRAVLKGAYISLPLLDTKETIFTTEDNPSPAPKNLNYQFKGFNTPQNVVTAAKDTGLGSWVFKYNTNKDNQIELNIPGGNYAGAYEGIMKWDIISGSVANNPAD